MSLLGRAWSSLSYVASLSQATKRCLHVVKRLQERNMPRTQDLASCTADQLRDFLDSFDVVLSDCDGVLWHINTPIVGAGEALNKLGALGKKIYLVSNNSTVNVSTYCERARKIGFDIGQDQVISTSKVVTWYLKKVNFKGEAFAIVPPAFREVLTNAGINLAEANPATVESDAAATIRAVEDRPSIKAVIADFNVYCDWGKLAFAISCLKRKDVLYLCGALDEWVVYGVDQKILGPGPLIDVITRQSGRVPIECAKPSENLKNYVLETCKLNDPRRCLFIGDTINYDMKFGAMCGFLKLFVSTGCDALEEAQKDKETCPEFYIESLGQLVPILEELSISPEHRSNDS
ncbi:hypothetical protein KM043_003511 [Ampulex compressa]|nr:hypothetical protein KM043_003511 [Ampulex compressa]